MMRILGISAFYHDSAAALVENGIITAAVQEERFTRKRHDDSFPTESINFCLKKAGITINDVDAVVFYDKPVLKLERLFETYLYNSPKGLRQFLKFVPTWLGGKLWIDDQIRKKTGFKGKIKYLEHHESHAASAFFPSPFKSAAVLCVDGVGEWATTTLAVGNENTLKILKEIHFPHSLGLLYSAFTYYTGFKVNSGEYKVMGLAPYGEPKYVQRIKDNLIQVNDDGGFTLNQEYFDYATGLRMTNEKFSKLFDGPPRKPESPLTQKEMDLAASVQKVTEEVMLKLARHAKQVTGEKNLCLAGGVALNCVANGKIYAEKIFDNIWIQPAAGDAGGALGAALGGYYLIEKQNRDLAKIKDAPDFMKGSLLGPSFSNQEIESFSKSFSAVSTFHDDAKLADEVAKLLEQGMVVGLFQGSMEFGPRSLGCRSIIADPRRQDMQSKVNLKVKFRESFRPFAPAVLEHRVSDFFDYETSSPYMLMVAPVTQKIRIQETEEDKKLWGIERLNRPRSSLPAITHVDYSARIQTIAPHVHGKFYEVVSAFEKRTQCPMVLNTSFNVRGEPLVNTPEEAYTCFMRTDIDALVMENHIFLKTLQPKWTEKEQWQKHFELD